MKLLTDIIDIIINISWVADISAVVVAFVIGIIWYHPMVFGTAWASLLGIDKEKLQLMKSRKALLWNLPIMLLIAANITAFCKHFDYVTSPKTFFLAYDLGLIVCLYMAMQYLYEGRSWKLYGINAGYTIVSMSAMGVVIGAVL